MNMETEKVAGGYTRGEEIPGAKGKTKVGYEVKEDPNLVLFEYKNDVTAFDQAKFTRSFENKAVSSNITNARIFEMLNAAGIPTAFVRQHSETEFIAKRCTMVPLEVVARRYAVGSFLKRNNPADYPEENGVPFKFTGRPVVEFFLKTTKGGLALPSGETLVSGLSAEEGEEDPYIPNPEEAVWRLDHPKKPAGSAQANLGRTVEAGKVLPSGEAIQAMREMTMRVFEVIEAFFEKHEFKFIDLKIEFGITPSGELVVADVIDNDSWRLRDQDWKEVSKQSFRDKAAAGDEDLSEVAQNYAIVANLLEKSRE